MHRVDGQHLLERLGLLALHREQLPHVHVLAVVGGAERLEARQLLARARRAAPLRRVRRLHVPRDGLAHLPAVRVLQALEHVKQHGALDVVPAQEPAHSVHVDCAVPGPQ